MAGLWCVVAFVLRVACYAALAFVLSGIVSLAIASASGLCPRIGMGVTRCTAGWMQPIAEWGFAVILLSTATVLPLALAAGGAVLALLATFQTLRRSA